jgi:hypothetical protein
MSIATLQGLLQAFIDFIVERKSVQLEELASEFGLKVQARASPRRTLSLLPTLSPI